MRQNINKNITGSADVKKQIRRELLRKILGTNHIIALRSKYYYACTISIVHFWFPFSKWMIKLQSQQGWQGRKQFLCKEQLSSYDWSPCNHEWGGREQLIMVLYSPRSRKLNRWQVKCKQTIAWHSETVKMFSIKHWMLQISKN